MDSRALTPLLPIAAPGQNFRNLPNNGSSQASDSDAMKAARQFEALFVKQLLAEVKISGGLGGQDSARSDFVDSMWRDQISKHMSQQGQGLGLAQVIARQLDGGAAAQRPDGGLKMAAGVGSASAPVSPGLRLYQNLLPEPPGFSDAGEFVRTLKPHIENAAAQLGVSPRVLMAQAALETGWGQHMPNDGQGRSSHNLFGIKADAGWRGEIAQARTQEYDGQTMQSQRDGFRAYAGVAHSVADYVQFLQSNPRYQQALQHGGSDKNFVQGLKSAGYATDPQYVEKVFDVAEGETLARHWNAI